MLKQLKSFIRQFFTLSKSEQKGIWVLALLILLVSGVNLLLPRLFRKSPAHFDEFREQVTAFREKRRQLQDSLRLVKLQNRGKLSTEQARQKLRPFPFDPNTLSDSGWLALGLTRKQVRSIQKFKAGGGRFRSKADFRKLFVISEAEHRVLDSFLRLPDESQQAARQTFRLRMTELNSADSLLLQKQLGLPPRLAARTVRYRALLGGFTRKEQLLEVYGLDSLTYDRLKNFVRIDTSRVRRLNPNTADFKTLLRHPYISYELTVQLVNTRRQNGGFRSLQEIARLPLVDDSLFRKLKPYLSLEN